MKKAFLSIIVLVLVVAVGSAGVSAATLTVHSDGVSGMYNTINAALAAASPGDVIDIIEPNGYFPETVLIDKANLSIKGQKFAPPVIFGAGAWSWPDGNTITVAKDAGDGLVLEDLVIMGGAGVFTAVRIRDGHETTGITIRNCVIGAPPAGDGDDNWDAAVFIYTKNKVTIENSLMKDGNPVLRVSDQDAVGGTTNVTITDSKIFETRVGAAVFITHPVTISFDRCWITSENSSGRHITVVGGPVNLTLTNSVIGADPGTRIGSANGIIIFWTGGGEDLQHQVVIDNNDFIGGWLPGGGPYTATFNALVFGDSLAPGSSITDNIFSGFSRFWFLGGAALSNPGPFATGIENYNVYAPAGMDGEITTNDLFDQHAFPEGANTLELTSAQPLYVDRSKGSIHLQSTSPAASHNSTGSPVYAGSRGIAPAGTVTVHSDGVTGHTRDLYDALSAVADGGVIEVIDNSVPFVGNLELFKRVTIRGQAGLDPKPVIQGVPLRDRWGIGGMTLFPNGTSANNSVFENITIDGRNASFGVAGWSGGEGVTYTNCSILGPQRDAGTGPFTHSQTLNIWYPITVQGSEIIGGNVGVITEGGGSPGLVSISDTVIKGNRGRAVQMGSVVNRQFTLDRCDISSLSPGWTIATLSPNQVLTMTDSIVRPDPETGFGAAAPSGIFLLQSENGSFFMDNCDVMGSNSGPAYAVLFFMTTSQVSITDSIFTNFSNRYWGVGNTASGNTVFFNGIEDYNLYGSSLANDIATADLDNGANVYPAGVHSINLTGSDALYVSVPAGGVGCVLANFKVDSSSPAATTARSAVGSQGYAGSQGVSSPSAVEDWFLY